MLRKSEKRVGRTYTTNKVRDSLRFLFLELFCDESERDVICDALWVASLGIRKDEFGIYAMSNLLVPSEESVVAAEEHTKQSYKDGHIGERSLFLSDATWLALHRLADLSKAESVEAVVTALVESALDNNGMINLTSLNALIGKAYDASARKRSVPLWTTKAIRTAIRAFIDFESSMLYDKKLNRFFIFLFSVLPTIYYFCKNWLSVKVNSFSAREISEVLGESGVALSDNRKRYESKKIQREKIYGKYIKENENNGSIDFFKRFGYTEQIGSPERFTHPYIKDAERYIRWLTGQVATYKDYGRVFENPDRKRAGIGS